MPILTRRPVEPPESRRMPHVEILGLAQLRQHARDIASGHDVTLRRGPERLLGSLETIESSVQEARRRSSDALIRGFPIAPAAEWLLDNLYLIKEQVDLARAHFPSGYSRALPRLVSGPLAGFPRVYALVQSLVVHSDAGVDPENLTHFVREYQTVRPLRLGELWAIPIMLRLTLLEHVRGVADGVSWRRRHRTAAAEWAQRFLRVMQEQPRTIVLELAEFVRSNVPLTVPFVAELASRLEEADTSLGVVTDWIRQELSDRGETIEMLVQAESQEQAANQVSMANAITSLRTLSAVDWHGFVEDLSAVEASLRRDPLSVYAAMDFPSRDRYRHAVEELALASRCDEQQVADAAVSLAADRHRERSADRREAHVGYFLVDAGRLELERRLSTRVGPTRRLARRLARRPLAIYLASLALIAVLLAAAPLSVAWAALPAIWAALVSAIAIAALSRPAVSLLNTLLTHWIPPRPLPRLDLSKGIPAEHCTAVIIPTLLTSHGAVESLLEQIEIGYLANRTPNLHVGLLTDFPDADRETLPGDQALLDAAMAGVRALNARHASETGSIFFLLHRPRTWNPSEGAWMGRERKRGKIEDFNRLVCDGALAAFSVREGDMAALRRVQRVVTLDTDTQLPPESLAKMVGAIGHPLNRPAVNPVTRCVERGYGILQPRLAVSLTSARRTRYASLMAGEVGIDPYTREVSNVYHDLFGRTGFAGKGIYDVRVFHKALDGRFPDDRILSHDLIEGCHARAGFLNDVELIEDHPPTCIADARRRHRWIRGDWQIARWLLSRVPTRDAWIANPLRPFERWMVADNLRRSLVPSFLFASLLLGWIAMPEEAARWTGFLVAAWFAPDALRSLWALPRRSGRVSWKAHLARTSAAEGRTWALHLLELSLLPFEAVLALDAIVRSTWRLVIAKRRLLEWQTAASVATDARSSFIDAYVHLSPAPIAAVCEAGVLAALGTAAPWPAALPILGFWLLGPALAWRLGRRRDRPSGTLSPEQVSFLRRLARRTWRYYEQLVSPSTSWLPPDHCQEFPSRKVAGYTSPTNIGMSLLSNLAAWDLGYITAGRLAERTRGAFETMDGLERHRGHFYNWYDLGTLRTLRPNYVSSVDSGNLVGSLLVLRGGLLEVPDAPILPARWKAGLADGALELAADLEAAFAAPAEPPADDRLVGVVEAIRRVAASPDEVPDDLPAARRALAGWLSQLRPLADLLADRPALSDSLGEVIRQCEDLLGEIDHLAPWVKSGVPIPLSEGNDETTRRVVSELSRVPTLGGLAMLPARLGKDLEALSRSPGCAEAAAVLERAVQLAADRATSRVEELGVLADRCEDFAEIDLDFLYDRTRKLLAIGYNVDQNRHDPSCYDLLASEARLASYLGVARGQLPVEHWFRLGRQLAPGKGPPVLVSWSGSLFEYLMPLLIMPSYGGTLLDQSNQGAVLRQVEYGRRRGVPWGVSESCYNHVDVQMTYQYRAFGVPSLGLKRGLADDLVVAPYASALALMVRPRTACENLRLLRKLGFSGNYGMYEAIDYTRSRLSAGEESAAIRSYMAHHQGMILLSILQAIGGQPMQCRFLAEPQLRASTLLLQERVPLARPRTHPSVQVADSPERVHPTAAGVSATRYFRTADTEAPEVHLLSNGRYHVMVTNSGGGYSRFQGVALTRWREDVTRDCWGTFFYLRDVVSGRKWSTTAQPAGERLERYEVAYSQASAEFRSRCEDIEVLTRIAVSPEDDVELRRMTITNRSGRVRTLELTGYAEVVLADPRAELGHPAFHGLFVETRARREAAAVVCSRRARGPEEAHPAFFAMMPVRQRGAGRDPSVETDRATFLGRGRTPANPAALDAPGQLSNSLGAVLDPCVAIRQWILLRPGDQAVVDWIAGAGESEGAADALIGKYNDVRMGERLFELAWTHGQVLLQHVKITEENAQLFSSLAGALLYPQARHRAGPGQIVRNRRGQSSLWAHGISGDLPIVLLRINDMAGLDLVRSMLQSHSYWRQKGLRADLVIWAEAFSGYRQTLVEAILAAVSAGSETKALDQPGGIFVRDANSLPEEDRSLLQAVARVVLSDRLGTLADQVQRQVRQRPEPPKLEASSSPRPSPPEEMMIPERDLAAFNGLGGFTQDGREYVIVLEPERETPRPWINVLANPVFGSIVSASGSSYTWYLNAHEYRLTPWRNDPVTDPTGEAFYVRDEETGAFWSPSPRPARGSTPYVCRHGLGYTVFEHTESRLFAESTVFVATDSPVKIVSIRLRNLSDRPRRLTVTGFCEWALGELREVNAMHVITRLDPQSGAIFAHNPFHHDMQGRVAFFACTEQDRTLSGDRTEFIGRNGSLARPAALGNERLSGRVGAALDPCAAIQARLEIPPREERTVAFVLGATDGEQEARNLLRRFGNPQGARQALQGVWDFWKHQLGGVHVETPDRSVNYLASHWLLYQALVSRYWGRSGFYQSGGAYGFRDQLQDSLAFLYDCPWLTREHILRAAGRQFVEGDVQHWWHPPSGRGTRTRISDDHLWLPYATARYVRVTGDTGLLDEQVPFLEGRPLAPHEESCYDRPQVSDRKAPLWEHLKRAISHGLRFGPNGLPLMGTGDWNDGMNRVGEGGRGESVWLAFLLHDVLTSFVELSASRGDSELEELCRKESHSLRERIEKSAWDGSWYRRAFFDDGTPLGSKENAECRIDSIAQSWSVLSGAAPEERADEALHSVDELLVDRRLGLIRLFDPPFEAPAKDPGYIRAYPAGVRENGGQYTHAAVWAVMAVAARRRADRAWELFRMIDPIRHGDSPERIERYKVEPYVVAADVYTAHGHEGRGGWTWYTGSAGWMYQLLVESLLGLRIERDTLRFEPLFPADWNEFTMHYRHRGTFYHIRVAKGGAEAGAVRRVCLDGADQEDLRIHLVDDQRDHHAVVETG